MAENATSKKTAEVPGTVTTHQEFLQNVDPKIMAALQAMDQLKSTNKVERAIRVNSLEVVTGKPKIRDGVPVLNEQGQPEHWDDSFYVEAESMGGTINLRVKPDQFKELRLNEWYIAVGRVVLRTKREDTRMYETIEYSEFQPLLGLQEA